MASGAKFWQEYWEEALKEVEKNLSFGYVDQRLNVVYYLHYFTMIEKLIEK